MTAPELLALILLLSVGAALVRSATLHRPQRRQPAPAPAAPSAVTFLRRHRWARRLLSGLSLALGVSAVGMLGYPLYTNLYQSRLQQRLDRQLVDPQLEQAYRDDRIDTGDALTRIEIPAIGVDVVVVEGTTASALRAGAGHYPQTPLPCEPGNVGIAGHRTTYGKPFSNLDRLRPGDSIILDTPVGTCTYEVEREPFVVSPSDTWVVEPTPQPSLTLTTCHPKGSAAQRLIIRARLQGSASST